MRTSGPARRWLAGAAAVLGVTGGVALIVAVAALPHPWTAGYVSAAGVTGAGRSGLYRWGVLALCGGQVLLGLAVGRTRAMLATAAPIAGGLLIAAGALGSVSAAVSCSPGCPLPPYEHATAQDLVHAAAACSAIGLVALALLSIAALAPPGSIRRAARIAAAISVPLLATLAITLLAIGRSATTAVLERLVLTVMISSVVTIAVLLAVKRQRAGPGPPPRRPGRG